LAKRPLAFLCCFLLGRHLYFGTLFLLHLVLAPSLAFFLRVATGVAIMRSFEK